MSAQTLPLAFNTNFDEIDRSNYKCTPAEISLYLSMLAVVRTDFDKWKHGLNPEQLDAIGELGAPHGLTPERSHRFMIGMAMLEARRKVSHADALDYFRAMCRPEVTV